jgi:hypothetical protein
MCLPHIVAVQLRRAIGKGKGARREAGPLQRRLGSACQGDGLLEESLRFAQCEDKDLCTVSQSALPIIGTGYHGHDEALPSVIRKIYGSGGGAGYKSGVSPEATRRHRGGMRGDRVC